MLKITIKFKGDADWLQHTEITATYQKGAFFCLFEENSRQVTKYPIENIWQIIEETDEIQESEEFVTDQQ